MILNEEVTEERNCQLHDFRLITKMLLARDICVRELIKRHYGLGIRDDAILCETMCPSCRGELSKVVDRLFLIDHMESEVFIEGSVSLGKLSSKLLERKGTFWVAKLTEIKASIHTS